MADIVFRGDIVAGQNITAVKAAMQARFKLQNIELEKLFSGKPVVIKKGLSKEKAESYQTLLHSLGAVVSLIKAEGDDAALAESVEHGGLTVAAVGSDVLRLEERQKLSSAEVNTSGISLSPEGVDVLDDKDKTPFIQVDIDTSYLDIE